VIGSHVTRLSISRLVGVGSDKLTCSADPESFDIGLNLQTEAFGKAVVSSGGTGADVKLGI
jgi:hypothetical protein